MADPTLKDLMAAMARLEKGQAEIRDEVAEVRADVNAHRAETDAHRKETAAGFTRLERELEAHADTAHRDLDEDVAAIHKGLVRAKVPGIAKELPSQVRAKGERPSKSMKKRKAR